MTYYNTRYYRHFNVFKQNKMQKRLKILLMKNNFSNSEIERILYLNAQKFLNID